jgi:hypothetical protein
MMAPTVIQSMAAEAGADNGGSFVEGCRWVQALSEW